VGRLAETHLFDAEELHSSANVNLRFDYNYRLWGFATAQHYGVPSVGLDVTHDILVALFFALHRFTINPSTGAMSVARADEAAAPIIYGLGGFENDLYEDEKLAPSWLQCARPHAQKAMFFSTGWGASTNKAASRICVALRPVDHMKWSSPFSSQELFPSAMNDSFLSFLQGAQIRHKDAIVQDILRKIYFVT
jgi:hypothetical protein